MFIFNNIVYIFPQCFCPEKRGQKVVYKYKKYEKFNLEDISVDGETGVPGDISLINRYQRKFKNKLPYRKNFRPEIIFWCRETKVGFGNGRKRYSKVDTSLFQRTSKSLIRFQKKG